jgi:hypothetical protein
MLTIRNTAIVGLSRVMFNKLTYWETALVEMMQRNGSFIAQVFISMRIVQMKPIRRLFWAEKQKSLQVLLLKETNSVENIP